MLAKEEMITGIIWCVNTRLQHLCFLSLKINLHDRKKEQCKVCGVCLFAPFIISKILDFCFSWSVSDLIVPNWHRRSVCCLLIPHGRTAVCQHLVRTHNNKCSCKMASEVIISHNKSAGTYFKISVKSIYYPENIKMRHEAEKGLKREHEIDYAVKEQLISAITGHRGKSFHSPWKHGAAISATMIIWFFSFILDEDDELNILQTKPAHGSANLSVYTVNMHYLILTLCVCLCTCVCVSSKC